MLKLHRNAISLNAHEKGSKKHKLRKGIEGWAPSYVKMENLICFLCTGGAYYVPYSFLLISNKFCNWGKRSE